MANKKVTKKKEKKQSAFADMIAQAKSRLPSARITICEGCFNPRNTLTVKPHTNHTWAKSEIQIVEDAKFVLVPCKFCKIERMLSLSKFSMDVFTADYLQFNLFMLLKDDRFNALVGITGVIDIRNDYPDD